MISHVVDLMPLHHLNQNKTRQSQHRHQQGEGREEVAARAAELKSAMMQMEQKRLGLCTNMTCCRSGLRLHRG